VTRRPLVFVLLAVAVAAASQSGNIVRLGSAHPLAMAAFRLILASIFLWPLALPRASELRRLRLRELALLGLSGIALALHLVTWIAAVQLTTVANAAVFFSVNPVITATASHLIFGERITKGFVGSVVLGLVGVCVLAVGDLTFSRADLPGDLLAVLCSFMFTAYFLLGKRLQRVLDSRVYVAALYGTAGLFGFVLMAVLGIPFFAYNGRTWLCFFLLALVPTMIGHSLFNYALRFIEAGRLSVVTLAEPPLAGLVAFLVWDEPVTLQALLGYTLIAASVVVLAWDEGRMRTTWMH